MAEIGKTKYIGWIPNTLGKISLSNVRTTGASFDKGNDTCFIMSNVFSSDAHSFPIFLGGAKLEDFFNFIIYIIQIPIFFILNLISNCLFDLEFLPEKKLLTDGLKRYLSNRKNKISEKNTIADFKYFLILKKDKDKNGFYENLSGNIYCCALDNYGPWVVQRGNLRNNSMSSFLERISLKYTPLNEDYSITSLDRDCCEFIKNSCDNWFFSANVEIHRSGICYFSNLSNIDFERQDAQQRGLEIANEERIYQQFFYFVKHSFHAHKHHTALHDTMCSAYEYSHVECDKKNKEFEAPWIKNTIYSLMRCSIAKKNAGNYFDAKGISDYTDSFVKIVENAVSREYPKVTVTHAKSHSIGMRFINKKLVKLSESNYADYQIAYYIKGSSSNYNSNLETLKKRLAANMKYNMSFKSKVLSRTVLIAFLSLFSLIFLPNIRVENLSDVFAFFSNNFSIVFFALLAVFCILDVLYSDSASPSAIQRNMVKSHFYREIRGMTLDTNGNANSRYVIKFFCVYINMFFVATTSIISDTTKLLFLDIPKGISKYLYDIYNYPHKA